MSELKVSPGFDSIEDEFEAALWCGFNDDPSSFLIIDSKNQKFLLECAAYGEERGWLIVNLNEIEEQYSRYELRLTEEGRKMLESWGKKNIEAELRKNRPAEVADDPMDDLLG